jgi:hypothetical protein
MNFWYIVIGVVLYLGVLSALCEGMAWLSNRRFRRSMTKCDEPLKKPLDE